jgi:hypothetical protein
MLYAYVRDMGDEDADTRWDVDEQRYVSPSSWCCPHRLIELRDACRAIFLLWYAPSILIRYPAAYIPRVRQCAQTTDAYSTDLPCAVAPCPSFPSFPICHPYALRLNHARDGDVGWDSGYRSRMAEQPRLQEEH